MAGPWEQYASTETGPWTQYGDDTEVGKIPADPRREYPAPPAVNQVRNPQQASLIKRLLGEGEVALSAISGIASSPYSTVVGLSHALRSGKFGTREGADIAERVTAESMQGHTYKPRTDSGQQALETFGGLMKNAVPLVGLPGEMNAIASLAKPSVQQARINAPHIVDAMKPTLDPEIMRLAKVAEAQGIPLRPDMLGTNKFGRVFGNFAEVDVPLSGSKANQRTTAFNQAIVRQIGGDESTGKLTPDVFASAMRDRGETIGDIASRTTLASADDLTASIRPIVSGSKAYSKATHRLVSTRADDLSKLVKNGAIDGTEFKKWNTKILEDIRAGDDVAKQQLSKLQDAAMDAFERNMAPDDLPVWKQNRQQYAIGKQLIPMIAESPIGDISPSKLMRAITSGSQSKNRMAYGQGGDLGDLAKIGQQFLKEPGMTSMLERGATYGMLGAAGLYGGVPGIAAGVTYGGANLYNRLGPTIVKSLTSRTPRLGQSIPELTTSLGFEPASFTRGLPTKLGDLTPEWTTSPGAGATSYGLDAGAGLVRSFDDPRVGTTRLKGRPQMPMAPGLLGVDDTAIAGQKWIDADTGAPMRMMDAPMAVGGIELSRIINRPKSAHRTKLLNDFKKRYPEAAKYIEENT